MGARVLGQVVVTSFSRRLLRVLRIARDTRKRREEEAYDAGYDRWIVSIAKNCRCCYMCSEVP